jgi:hypothetical protein
MKTLNNPVGIKTHLVMKANPIIVQAILQRMQAVTTKYKLEVLQRYPDDLLVHDKAMLERFAVPDAKIAWMVGHSHTHLVALGFHPIENLNVGYLTHLANEDRFFVLNIGRAHSFKLSEIDRTQFAALSDTLVPYERRGSSSNFYLHRDRTKLGHVALEQLGTWQNRKIKAVITPQSGISEHAHAALGIWCSYAVTELTGTLFVESEVNWAAAVDSDQAG